jgi:O-antigen/teichoic acid export membrane protein
MKKNLIYSILGFGFWNLSQWLLVVILARTLNLGNFGTIMFIISLITPILYFTGMNLRPAIATHQSLEKDYNDFLGYRIFSIIISLLILLIGMSFSELSSNINIFLLIFVWKSMEVFSELLQAYFQNKNFFNYLVVLQIIKSILITVGLVIASIVTTSPVVILLIINFIWIIIIVGELSLVRNMFKIKVTYFSSFYVEIIKKYKFLALSLLVSNLLGNVPRYLIEMYYKIEFVGIFSAIFYISIIIGSIANAVLQVLLPKFSDLIRDGKEKQIRKIINKLNFITVLIGFIWVTLVAFFGDFILDILYGSEYSEYNIVLITISIGSFLNILSLFWIGTLIATGKFKLQLYVNIISLFSIFITGLIILKYFKFEYIGYSFITTYLLQMSISFYFGKLALKRGEID